MLTKQLIRLKSLLHPRVRLRRTEDGTAEYECPAIDVALAVCVDSLRPEVGRVEVRIGRELAEKTNPEKLKVDVHRAARSFVRDGQTTYSLSVDWADALERQDRIYVRVHPRAVATAHAPGKRKPTPDEVNEVRREIADEFVFTLTQLKSQIAGPVAVEEITIVCRDPGIDSWLSGIAPDGQGFSRSLKTLVERHARFTPDFRASYRFEGELPGTTAVGQGVIAVEVVPCRGDGSASTPRQSSERKPPHSGTYEICEEPSRTTQPQALVTFVGLGRDTVPDEPACRLDLPAVINRHVLSATSLGRDADCLQVVSESNPLRVVLKDGRLCLCANARRSADGFDRPGYFLIDGDREIPIVGEQIVAGEAEVLIGSESHRIGRSPSGVVLRPPRIRIVAQRPEGSS